MPCSFLLNFLEKKSLENDEPFDEFFKKKLGKYIFPRFFQNFL